jgi:hypothetical protein
MNNITPNIKTIDNKPYIIQKVTLDDTYLYDRIRFNSNNYRENNEQPVDYQAVLEKSSTKYWIDKIHINYTIINIQYKNILWLKEASLIGVVTGRFSHMFDDELSDLLKEYDVLTKRIFTDNKYFVRTERFSLKYGVHGTGPYSNLKNIIESLVTSINGHNPMKNDAEYLKLYLLPWRNIDTNKEFRVFVYQNKITAISQQFLHQNNEYLQQFDITEKCKIINTWIDMICAYFESTIKKNINHVSNYTFDVAILDNEELYFIEINSFGKEYAAGSALFHWIIDQNILYGNESNIYFRYTCY